MIVHFCMLGALVCLHVIKGEDDNLILRIKDGISVDMSTQYANFSPSYAVDGNEETLPDSCYCCAGTTQTAPFWWRLNLGREFLIKTIIFIGRSDHLSSMSRKFSIFKGFSNSTGKQELLYENTAASGHNFSHSLNPPVALQRLEVSKPSLIVICELKLVEYECPDGQFGIPCELCGKCTSFCNKSTGICPDGCQPGYRGDLCKHKCGVGTFGQNCESTCHCLNNETCYPETGECPGNKCAPGWQAFNCSLECDDGKFGQDCQTECHCQDQVPCEKSSGTCSSGQCAKGWKGDSCSTECGIGTFGQNCGSTCHCLNNETCYPKTGECPGNKCAPGWQAFNCSLECDDGKFGQDCQTECHCQDQVPCEKVNGTCSSGQCAKGWEGAGCSTECDLGSFGQNCGSTCHCLNNAICDHINGSCPNNLCAPGWHAMDCNTECDDGRFGLQCQNQCHCRDQVSCEKVNGSCPSGQCSKGWKGNSCSTRCNVGSFGQNCSSMCHCLANATCHHTTGECPGGRCASGWTGIDCSTVAKALKTPDEVSPIGAIVGAVVGVLVLLLTVVIAVIVYWKRNRQPKSNQNHENFSALEEDKASGKTAPKKLSQRKQPRKQTSAKDTVDVATDHTYYAFDSKAKPIPIYEIWDYLNLEYINECERLHQEFQKLPSGLVHECNEAKRPDNAKKTRYKQMFAYDHSRVVLKRDDPKATTYINACYIDGYKKMKKFIASQGPMDAMVSDFWEMIIQESTSIIIMLTNVVEHGVTKCIQYWPISENERLKFGDITVLTSKIDRFPDYTVREIDISKEGEPPKRITQYHFTAWPDKDVPDTAWHLVNFWRKVNSVVQTVKEPVVVHCSAGIGRTGTFIGLDNLYAQANAKGYIKPFDIITRLRHQRVNMVQTKFQYVFLHEAVAEALYIGVKPVKANEFDAVYKLLLEPDNTTGVTGLEQQHRLIKENPTTISDETTEYCNVSSTKECDAYRPNSMRSSSPGKDDNPNMCHVHNYAGKDTYIVTRASNEDTVASLWKTIEKHNIKTVITLHNEIDRAETVPGKQSEDGHSKNAVQLTETKREKHFIEQTFTAKQSKSGKESRTIKQFMFLTTKDKTANTASVISFLNAIQRWQPSVDESQPILITHENAYERCGLICLLLCEFERIRSKDSVNILATVKHLKDKNPRLIPDYEQYKLCYSAVAEYIRQSDVYMNV